MQIWYVYAYTCNCWRKGMYSLTFVSLKRIWAPNRKATTELEDLAYIVCILFCFRISGRKILRKCGRKMTVYSNAKPFQIWNQFRGFPWILTPLFELLWLLFLCTQSQGLGCLLNSQLLSLAVEISRQTNVICSQSSIRALLGKFPDKSLSWHKEDGILWYNDPSLHS